MIEEVKKKPKPKKRPNLLYRFFAFLATVGLVAGAVGLVANRDKLNFDAIRRFFTYHNTAQSEDGATEAFAYGGGLNAGFTSVGGDLFSASVSGFRLYSPGGTALVDETLTLANPAFSVSGGAVVAYDAGGTELRVYKDRAQAFALTSTEGAILSARINSAGWLAVVTRATGFKGIVTVYNSAYQKVIAFRVSSTYILDAVVSPDNKSVAVLTAGQNGHTFESSLVKYTISTFGGSSSELVPSASLSLGNRIPLFLKWANNTIWVFTEQNVITADGELVQLGDYDWSDRYLKLFSLEGEDFSAALLGKYRAGSQAELRLTDQAGELISSLELTEQVLSLSASGRYVAILTADRLDIYTKDMSLYASLDGTQGARQVVARSDGTALLISSESAWLYIPN